MELNHWEHGEHWDLKYCDESLIDVVLAATEVHRHFGNAFRYNKPSAPREPRGYYS